MRLVDKVLILFLVTSGIHRMDLLGGKAGFIMLPVLAIALVLIPLTGLIISTTDKIRVHKNVIIFILSQFFLGVWFFITLLGFEDILQIKRLILFLILTTASSCFLILFNQSDAKKEILNSFIKYSFRIYVLFSLTQIYFFLQGKFGGSFVEPFSIFILNPPTIGVFFPRLTGGLYDPNIGGYFLTFLFLLNRQIGVNPKINKYIALLILLTLSRSAIVAFIIIIMLDWLIWLLLNKHRFYFSSRMKTKYFVAFIGTILIFIIVSFYIFNYTNLVHNFINGVEARLFNKDNSTSIHLGLFQTAVNGILHDPWHFVKGYGFSSSFLYTQEYFPGNKYGNFHSELITIFFEAGLVGVLIYVLILILPLITLIRQNVQRNINYILIVVAIFLQGIFYQQYLFQYYWIMIAFVWLLPFLNISDSQNKN